MTWTLTHHARPWTVNTERNWHYHQRARQTREWRAAFGALALQATLPRPFTEPVIIVACLRLKGARSQDPGACFPAVKAAIDGLVDAGILLDDDGQSILAITFTRPTLHCEKDTLTLLITETEP